MHGICAHARFDDRELNHDFKNVCKACPFLFRLFSIRKGMIVRNKNMYTEFRPDGFKTLIKESMTDNLC